MGAGRGLEREREVRCVCALRPGHPERGSSPGAPPGHKLLVIDDAVAVHVGVPQDLLHLGVRQPCLQTEQQSRAR